MKAWRLSCFASASRSFDGEGARLFPGRWNAAGVPVVYASEHLSLAALEVLVHARMEQLRVTFHAFEITLPDDSIELLAEERLPRGWDAPTIARASRELGSAWAREGRTLSLSVPSMVVRQERNLLLNPLHPGFAGLAIGRPVRFRFDDRLVRAPAGPSA